jgi:hypothetical protein
MDESRHGIDHASVSTSAFIPPVFNVVGENRDDPDCLLLLGDDGQHYRYHLLDGTTAPAELDDHWVIDSARSVEDHGD